MSKAMEYEAYKAYLRTLNLSTEEYTRRIIAWCKKNNY